MGGGGWVETSAILSKDPSTVDTPNFVILFAIMFPSTKYKSDIYE